MDDAGQELVVNQQPSEALRALWRSGVSLLPKERTVSLSSIRYEYGFGFGDLYHPYTEVLAESSLDEAVKLLSTFYDTFEKWRGHLNDWQALPVQFWRFGKTGREERRQQRVASAHFGLVKVEAPDQAQSRVKRLFDLRDSILTHGYQPEGSQTIDGVRIGDTVLILGGQNRVATLASLGHTEFRVNFTGRKNTPPRLVANRLPLVKYGHLPLDDAEAILSRIQNGFGFQAAREHGFPLADPR